MRLRRKNDNQTPSADEVEPVAEEIPETPERATGPVDIEDIDPETVYVDLGSLLVPTETGLELRLQIDEESGTVLAALLVADEGILEARAFASARGGDLWADARREIAADTVQRGGTAREQEGSFGPELFCEVPVTGPDGESLIQPSRVIGHNGPRWFLRATIAGRPAQDPEYAEVFEQAVRSLVVRRGNEAMAPGEVLPLKLPPEVRAMTAAGPDATAED